MRRFVPLFLTFAIVVTLTVSGSISEARAQSAGIVSSILNRMERNRRELKSLRANITMEKYDANIKDSDRSTGIVLYMPGSGRYSFVRVEWHSPQREILAVANGEYTLFRPRLNMAWVGKASSTKNKVGGVLDFLSMSSQQVKTRFEPLQDIYEETLWGGVRTTHLKLVPKSGASYKYAEIWIDAYGMPVQAKVVEKNDDSTTIRLTNMERNPQISADAFKVQLDSSVRRVRG